MKTSELHGAALDWAVAQCEGAWVRHGFDDNCPEYSTDWAQGGPIMEKKGMSLNRVKDALWEAKIMGDWTEDGPTPLIAAMRCYVGSQLGNDVDIPEELQEITEEWANHA